MTLRTPTREEIWPLLPPQASGPAWAERIDAALEAWHEYGACCDDMERMVAEYAETATPVYNADRVERFTALDLWAISDIEDRALELDIEDLIRAHGGIVAVMGLYVWLAEELLMQTVARAAGARI